jgi:thiosulfate/3-mercaptopyruvate sulfurtransferase
MTNTLLTTRPVPRAHVLADRQWLEDHLHDPNVVLVEVDVSRAAYDNWHIDGAALWNIYADLKDDEYHPVAEPELARLIARSGISADSTIVFYGYGPAMGFWLMKLHGHQDVRILDCSRDTWQSEGRPTASSAAAPAVSDYRLGPPDDKLRANHAAVLCAIGTSSTLADVRTESEYLGERFWPSGGMEPGGRAGHLPGAVHQPIDGLYDDRGAFRDEAELRQILSAIDLDGDGDLITYCTIGGRASTAWFVLSYLLGRDHVRVYDGSWAEWGRLPDTEVAVAVAVESG